MWWSGVAMEGISEIAVMVNYEAAAGELYRHSCATREGKELLSHTPGMMDGKHSYTDVRLPLEDTVSFTVYRTPRATKSTSSEIRPYEARYDMSGRLLYSWDMVPQTIDVSAMANGVYLLKATWKDGTLTAQRIIGKH